MLSEFLRTIPAGKARAAFVCSVDDAVRKVFDWAARQEPLRRVATSHFPSLPDLRTLIDTLLNDLADVARGVWPYTVHSSIDAFSSDRQRDYELLVSGYLVLRLPHDEVLDNVEFALSKIRRVAALRQHLVSSEGSDS